MKIIIAGGGTGGHLYPGIALAREFQRQDGKTEVLFVGTAEGIEAKVLPRENLPLRIIPVKGLMGKGWRRRLASFFFLPESLWESAKILREFRPDLVIGMGGYVSGPLLIASGMMGLKRVIIEPNRVPGFTNRALARCVHAVVVAFDESRQYLKGRHVRVLGTPVRTGISQRTKDAPLPGRQTLLILGGSQGAHSINRALIEALDHLRDRRDALVVVHQTGERDFRWVKEAYEEKGFSGRIEPYLFEIAPAYQAADLIISRAGAAAVAEITAAGKPAILIPYPYATHGHQQWNAESLARAGAAVVIANGDLKGEFLARTIMGLLGEPGRLREMAEKSRGMGRPEAARLIVQLCKDLVEGNV